MPYHRSTPDTGLRDTASPAPRVCSACGVNLPDGIVFCRQCGAQLRDAAPQGVQRDTIQNTARGASPSAADLLQRQTVALLICDFSGWQGEAADILEACTQAAGMFGGWPAYADGGGLAFGFDPPGTRETHQFGVTGWADRAFDAGLNVILDLGRTCPGLTVALLQGEAIVGKSGTSRPDGTKSSTPPGAELLDRMHTGGVLEGPTRDAARAMCRAAPTLSMVVSSAAAKGLAPARRALLRSLPTNRPTAQVGGAYLWQPILPGSG